MEVPLKVNKGSYHFTVFAGETKLPLEVVVAQKGTYQTEFTTDQPNMQGISKPTFTFNATLKNQTADQQLYALMANAPRGWSVVFKPNYKQATSAQVEANSSQNVSIEIVLPPMWKPVITRFRYVRLLVRLLPTWSWKLLSRVPTRWNCPRPEDC